MLLQSVRHICKLSSRCLFSHPNPKPMYIGEQNIRVKRTKYITLLSSASVTALTPIIAMKKFHLSAVGLALACGLPIVLSYACTAVIYYTTMNYVTEMYIDSDDDMLVIKKLNLFVRPKTYKVSPLEIEVPANIGLTETFKVGKDKFFIDENLIEDPKLYKYVTGMYSNRT